MTRLTWVALWRTLLPLLLVTTLARADELCLTGNARRNQNLPVAYTIQPEAAKPLFDGSEVDGRSVGMQDGTVTLKFAEPVRVTRVAVVVYNDPKRSFNAGGRFRATLRGGEAAPDGSAWVPMDGDAVMTCGKDDALILGSRSEAALSGAKAGDTVAVQLEKKPGAYQMLVREIYVWGMPERLASAAGRAGTPLAGAVVTANTYSSLRVQWPSPPGETAYCRVSWRAKGETAWQRECYFASPAIVLWLRPYREYEVSAEAVGTVPGAGVGRTLTVRLPHPLEMRTMGDAWGMNFYPGGGGAHQARPDEGADTQAMVRLLREAGVRHVRWWIPAPGFAEVLADNGMSLVPSATYTDPAGYEKLARTCGVWLTQTTNEPDFANVFADEYVKQFLAPHAAARRFSPLMCIAGPAIGGEMVGPGSDYLTECYAAGLKDAVDAVDLHPYGKYSTPNPPGSTVGGPEGLLSSLAAAREAMGKAGDSARPVIASESGHPTYEGNWFMPASSYERQAQWIVRTHLLFVASGIRRIIWYAFQDEGTDKANAEHCFGIVDWNGKPKPAYESYRTMTKLLSEAKCEGLEPGLKAPVYGVRALLPPLPPLPRRDGGSGSHVTPLWDSGGTSEVRIASASAVSGIVSLMGETLPVPKAVGGAVTLTVDENVRYVYSAKPLVYLSQKRLSPPVEPQVQMALTPTTVLVQPGKPATWSVHLTSDFACPVTVDLDTGHPFGGTGPHMQITLPPKGKADVPMGIETPATAKRQIVSWDVRCRYAPSDTQWHKGDFRRAIFFEVKIGG